MQKRSDHPNRIIRDTCPDGWGDVEFHSRPTDNDATPSLHVRKDRNPTNPHDRIGFLAYTCPSCRGPHIKDFLGQSGITLINLLEDTTNVTIVEYDPRTEEDTRQDNTTPILDIEEELKALEDLDPEDFNL